MLLTAPADEAHMKKRQMEGFGEPAWKEPEDVCSAAKFGFDKELLGVLSFLGGMPRAAEPSELPHLARHRFVVL